MKKIFCFLAITVVLSMTAFADVRLPDTPKPTPSPKQKKTIESNMEIRLEKGASDARLLIPKSQLKQLRAALDESDDAENNTALNITRTQTIVSGLFLSLAVVFGGVWFSRSRGKSGGKMSKTIAAGAVLFFIGSAATLAYANIGPPMQLRSITSDLFNKQTFGGWKRANGKVKVEVSDGEGMIQLIVPEKEDAKPEE